MRKKLAILALLIGNLVLAQSQYGIVIPTNNNERNAKCQYFSQMFRQKPKEIRFGIKREGNTLFFEISDKQWFTKLFKQSGDGIAVDIVPKTRYACGEEIIPQQIKGLVLQPVYAKELRRNLKPFNTNFRVYVGKVPEPLAKDDLEFNILFLNNKVLCKYYSIYNLESYPWELLDMGVYLDSLAYKTKAITTSKEAFVKKYKTLQFTIPFKKNKATYLPEDIKPLYDSLRLTDFTIKKIDIKAYASVEGSLERNKELQEQRAKSIATALQTFQQPQIVTQISSSENWVEFLNDIKNTNYADLAVLSKKEVKRKLVGATAAELEPYLKKHRKAVVILELDKIDKYKNMTVTKLVTLFNERIAKDKLEEAAAIQNAILEKMKSNFSPETLLAMEIPRQKKYLTLLTKNSVIKYLVNISQALIVTSELQQLQKLDPKNQRIQYNLAVLKFIIWRSNAQPVNEETFKKEIINLKKYGIAKPLIDRMLVNFYIVKAEKEMRKRNYKAKDTAVKYIVNNYHKFPLSNYDYLSLAQFLTYYANMEEAVSLLDKKARSITIDEDLLFYYINLTIINKKLTASSEYRTIMLNAITKNKDRFCKLFNPSLEGGVTFQLLEDAYLRKTYCENCAE
ncbi:hypothetical protein P8625_00110 [Tenacibaculum tangerinum]|uniref:OmpA-like domain-containing protein n=1 Tax=Tenacibaculum tangerinum TaxID=3038772 RepID=A0ABY8L609_9FLAO|nr:hypothetical protein [Tenacibaculum tangerinum]WGH75600.1 hypothetical protein P8625_00110 [Tenacibaculum tangerinum]